MVSVDLWHKFSELVVVCYWQIRTEFVSLSLVGGIDKLMCWPATDETVVAAHPKAAPGRVHIHRSSVVVRTQPRKTAWRITPSPTTAF